MRSIGVWLASRPMAVHVHLVRHGEVHNPDHLVYADLAGFGLSDLGRAQAREVARYLGSRPVVAVWSSPLQRALETAAPIAARAGVPTSVDERLVEWALLGEWAGLGWDRLAELRPGELEAYLDDPLGSAVGPESLTALARRMSDAVREINTRHREGDVVVVGHQDPVQAVRLALTGRDLSTLHTAKPSHGSVITLSPAPSWREEAYWEPAQDA